MLNRLLKKPTDTAPSYVRRSLFDAEKKAFYGRLRRALPKCYLFPNIGLDQLMVPAPGDPKQQRWQQEQLSGRTVDFAIFDARLHLLCVIELTPAEPGVANLVPNADLLKAAGIKRFCWDEQQLPSTEQLLRTLAEFSSLPSPSAGSSVGPATISAAPQPGACKDGPPMASLNLALLAELAPQGRMKARYPHVWERVCLFCSEPAHLEVYLASLSIQDRSTKRAGFPPDVLVEITAIQAANRRFVPAATPSRFGGAWNDLFADR
jgi:hypothetical protein